MSDRLSDDIILAELAQRSAEEQHDFVRRLCVPDRKADRLALRDRFILEFYTKLPSGSICEKSKRILREVRRYEELAWKFERDFLVYPGGRPDYFRFAWHILKYSDGRLCLKTIRNILSNAIRQKQRSILPG